MARYFFHLHECGDITNDEEGRELIDLAAARDVAVKAAREVMSAEVMEGRLCLSCHVDIHDAEGQHLVHIPFRDVLTVSGLPEPTPGDSHAR